VSQLGDKSSLGIAREVLYFIAPCQLWQLFSGIGGSGTKKKNFAGELPMIYKVVVSVVVSVASKTQASAKALIGKVLTSCVNRKISRKFRREHPDLFSSSSSSETDE
jgi:hypothetical protein